MILYRRVPEIEPADALNVMNAFVGTFPQRIVHNKLVDAQQVALEALSKGETYEQLLIAKTKLNTILEILGILHFYDDKQTRNDFTITQS